MSTPTTLVVPAGVEVVTVTTARGEFAAHDAPALGAEHGHVLLVPGFTGSKEDFTPLLPLLAGTGWHATAYDQRGQYETPGGADDDYSLAGFAADALAVRTATARGTAASHLVGHSFGGLVAQHAVLAEPTAWVSVTLMCTGPAGFTGAAKVKPLQTFVDAVPGRGLAAVFDVMQARKAAVAPDVLAFLRERFTRNSPAAIVEVARRLVDAPDRIDELAQAGVPTCVLRGHRDAEWSPAVQDEMATRLGVQVVVVPGSGHSPAVEHPAATSDLLAAWFSSAVA